MQATSMQGTLAHTAIGTTAPQGLRRPAPAQEQSVREDRVQGRGQSHRSKGRDSQDGATRVTLSAEAKEAQAAEAPGELTTEEQQEVKKLQERDAEVRAHEQAHLAAAGGYARGGVKYDTQRGPDNKLYAVGGHVEIDTAPVEGDPAKTIQKAQTVRRAALAPLDPSGQDRQVAARATQTENRARQELAAEHQEARSEMRPGEGAEHGPAQSGELEASTTAPRSYAMSAYARFAG